MSAFMLPYYEETSYSCVENARGESRIVPTDALELEPDEHVESESTGILWRLSAPGYLDCTEWTSAPSLEAAMLDCLETFAICPSCGEYTDESDEEESAECLECGEPFPVRKEGGAS